MFCALAASGEIVRVPEDGRFVCPQCGRALVSPNTPFHSARRHGNVRAALSILLILVGFVVGMALGGILVWPVSPAIVPLSMTHLAVPPPVVSVPVLTPPAPAILTLTRPKSRRRVAPADAPAR